MPASVQTNGMNGHSSDDGLKVIIIGAGIGGLAAATNLANQGHKITVLYVHP